MIPQAATIIARLIGAGLSRANASKIADKIEWAGTQVYNATKHNKWDFDPQGMKSLQREFQDLPIPEVQKWANNEMHDAISIATSKARRG